MFAGVLILAVCTSLGLAAAGFASWRQRPALRLYFAPIIGLAILVHAAALFGWLSGLPRTTTLPLTAILAMVALWRERRRWRGILQSCGLAAAAFAAGGWALWTCLLRFSAFNPLNDTFTYLVHAQWLQNHAFLQRALFLPEAPALSQVTFYQDGQLRMGASFLLGWVQSVAGAPWALDVWPAVVTLPTACGSLAMAGGVWLSTGRRRWLCLAFGLLPGLSLSGLTFAQVHGFLPQSFGLAFAFGSLLLAAQGGRFPWPAALCLSAQIYCYPEALPFTLAGWALLLCRKTAWRALLLGLALAAPELPRAWHGVRFLTGLKVGVNLPISALESLGHATGLHSGPWDDRQSLLWLLPVVLAGLAGIAGLRRKSPALLACGAVVASLALAWLWFGLVETNSWQPSQTGNPWRQARAAAWAAWPALLLVSAGLARWWPHARWAVSGALAVWLISGAAMHYQLAAARIAPLQREVLCQRDCFDKLAQIPAQAPHNGAIWLNGFLAERSKYRQLVTYLLMDRPVLADWTGDDYILPNPATELRHAQWVFTPTPSARFQPIQDAPRLQAIEGGYAEETSGASLFRWTADQLRYRFVLPQPPARLRVRFELDRAGARNIRLSANGAPPESVMDGVAIFPAPTGPQWTLVFSTDQPPQPPHGNDPRALAFLVRNLSVELLRSEP